MTVELWDDDIPEETYEEPAPLDFADEAEALDRANWHGRHLRRLWRERSEVERVYDAEIQRLLDRRVALVEKIDRDIAWHETPIKGLHAALLDLNPKRKTIGLPNVTMRARAGQPRWEFDPDVFLGWARTWHPDLIRVKEEIDRAAAKKALKAVEFSAVDDNGEIVPGIEVLEPETKFWVELPEDPE